MADELKGNSPEITETPEVETPEAPETPEPELPEQYKGKTAEELAKILQDKESEIGRQSSEVGDLRTKMEDLERQAAYNQQFGTKEPTSYQDPYRQGQTWNPEGDTLGIEPTPPTDEDPITHGDLKKMLAQQQQQNMAIQYQLQMATPFIEQARKEVPHIFKGLTDQEIKGRVHQQLAGGQLHPMHLSNPITWKKTAMDIQGEKTNYNFSPVPAVANPVDPVATATPSQNKPMVSEEEVIPITEEERQYARETLGKKDVTDDEIREMIIEGAVSQERKV